MDIKKIREVLNSKTDSELLELTEAYVHRFYYLTLALENKHLQGFTLNEFGMSYSEEKDMIEQKRGIALQIMIKRNDVKIKEKIIIAKKTIKIDGNLKREVANYLINMLEGLMSEDEIKGVFRQGYKEMRHRGKE